MRERRGGREEWEERTINEGRKRRDDVDMVIDEIEIRRKEKEGKKEKEREERERGESSEDPR